MLRQHSLALAAAVVALAAGSAAAQSEFVFYYSFGDLC